jgi:hypothetical protein
VIGPLTRALCKTRASRRTRQTKKIKPGIRVLPGGKRSARPRRTSLRAGSNGSSQTRRFLQRFPSMTMGRRLIARSEVERISAILREANKSRGVVSSRRGCRAPMRRTHASEAPLWYGAEISPASGRLLDHSDRPLVAVGLHLRVPSQARWLVNKLGPAFPGGDPGLVHHHVVLPTAAVIRE